MSNTHYWTQTRAELHCASGDHYVWNDAWMQFRIGDHRQLGSCESCLAKLGVYRAERMPTSVGTLAKAYGSDHHGGTQGEET